MRKLILLTRSFLFLGLCLGLFFGLCGCKHQKTPPRAVEGILDLREWDFKKDGFVSLAGQWSFFWNQQIPPGRVGIGADLPDSGFMVVPGTWNRYRAKNETIFGIGFATYSLKIFTPPGQQHLALKLLDMSSAFTLYVNGVSVAGAGIPGKTPEETIPAYAPGVVDFVTQGEVIDIVVHISNFHHRQGGMWEPVLMGAVKNINGIRQKRLIQDSFLLGAILIMGLYHLGLFWFLRQNRASLYFGLFNLLIGLRLLTTGETYLVQMVDGISHGMLNRMVYLSFYGCVPLFALYVNAIFPKDASLKFVRAIVLTGVGFFLLVSFTPVAIFSYSMPVFQVITLGVIVYFLWGFSRAILRKRQGAAIFLMGFLILFVTVVNDILYSRQIIISGYYAPLGLFCFIFFQSFLLSQRFSGAYLTIEKQWQQLGRANRAYKEELENRIQAQTDLKESETQYRQLIEDSADGICIIRGGMIQYANSQFINMAGMGDQEMGRLSFLEFIHPDDREKMSRSYETAIFKEKELAVFFVRGMDKQGRVYDLELNSSRIEWDKRSALMTFVRDMTEQTQTRELLFQSEKMLSVGGLAAGMAHEINNPLAGMMQNAQVVVNRLSESLPANDKAAREIGITMADIETYARKRGIHRLFDNIVSAGQIAADIVENMLSFARKSPADKEKCSLEQIVDKTLALLENDFALTDGYDFKQIQILKEYVPELPLVLCGENKIGQVLLNLFKNAAQAMQSVSGKRLDRITIRLFREEQMVCCSIKDNGPGMDEAIQKRIFEPFFTTKQPHEGTGLGLSVSYFIITEDHRGQMEVISGPNKGSEFIIRLPLA